jgi:hypothetical protein
MPESDNPPTDGVSTHLSVAKNGLSADGCSADGYFELAQRQAASQAVKRVLDEHMVQVLKIREDYELDDLDLLSININKHREIDKQVREQVASLQAKMRTIIEQLAKVIADRMYATTEQSIPQTFPAKKVQTRAMELVKGDKAVNLSCRGLREVTTVVRDLNKRLIEQLEQSEAKGDKQTARKMLLANALLVYELLDFAIGYIADFKVLGVDEIRHLYDREMQNVNRLLNDQDKREKQANADNVHAEDRDEVLSNVTLRRDVLKKLAQEWENYVKWVEDAESKAMSVRGRLASLRLRRDDAKDQIEVIQAVSILAVVRSNVGEIENAMRALEEIHLAPLTAERVELLLGESP